jgi:hypothetical protein
MMPGEEWNAVLARRALLRQQTEFIGPRLPWLADPSRIPDEAIASSIEPDDIHLAAFSLASWMLIEIVRVADQVQPALDWEGAVARYEVAPRLQESVARAVLSPASRYAPGLFAIAEIVSVVPAIASRAGVPRDLWLGIAQRCQAFGAQLARDNTAVQVLLRSYLGRADVGDDLHDVRVFDPARLRLDEATGMTTTTPLETLLEAARKAAAGEGHAYHAACVAMQAPSPVAPAGTEAPNMFGAIWLSFAHAADRLVFPRFDPRRAAVPPEAAPDPACEITLGELAAQRGMVLSATASQPYPDSVERIFSALLSARP